MGMIVPWWKAALYRTRNWRFFRKLSMIRRWNTFRRQIKAKSEMRKAARAARARARGATKGVSTTPLLRKKRSDSQSSKSVLPVERLPLVECRSGVVSPTTVYVPEPAATHNLLSPSQSSSLAHPPLSLASSSTIASLLDTNPSVLRPFKVPPRIRTKVQPKNHGQDRDSDRKHRETGRKDGDSEWQGPRCCGTYFTDSTSEGGRNEAAASLQVLQLHSERQKLAKLRVPDPHMSSRTSLLQPKDSDMALLERLVATKRKQMTQRLQELDGEDASDGTSQEAEGEADASDQPANTHTPLDERPPAASTPLVPPLVTAPLLDPPLVMMPHVAAHPGPQGPTTTLPLPDREGPTTSLPHPASRGPTTTVLHLASQGPTTALPQSPPTPELASGSATFPRLIGRASEVEHGLSALHSQGQALSEVSSRVATEPHGGSCDRAVHNCNGQLSGSGQLSGQLEGHLSGHQLTGGLSTGSNAPVFTTQASPATAAPNSVLSGAVSGKPSGQMGGLLTVQANGSHVKRLEFGPSGSLSGPASVSVAGCSGVPIAGQVTSPHQVGLSAPLSAPFPGRSRDYVTPYVTSPQEAELTGKFSGLSGPLSPMSATQTAQSSGPITVSGISPHESGFSELLSPLGAPLNGRSSGLVSARVVSSQDGGVSGRLSGPLSSAHSGRLSTSISPGYTRPGTADSGPPHSLTRSQEGFYTSLSSAPSTGAHSHLAVDFPRGVELVEDLEAARTALRKMAQGADLGESMSDAVTVQSAPVTCLDGWKVRAGMGTTSTHGASDSIPCCAASALLCDLDSASKAVARLHAMRQQQSQLSRMLKRCEELRRSLHSMEVVAAEVARLEQLNQELVAQVARLPAVQREYEEVSAQSAHLSELELELPSLRSKAASVEVLRAERYRLAHGVTRAAAVAGVASEEAGAITWEMLRAVVDRVEELEARNQVLELDNNALQERLKESTTSLSMLATQADSTSRVFAM